MRRAGAGLVGQAPAHQQRRGERQQREQPERDAPVRGGGQQRHADAADQPAGDERGDVVAHRARAERRRVGLRHVGDADGDQARHAQPLQRPQREQHLEARRQRHEQRRHHDRAAGEHERGAPADAVRERSPEPGADRQRADHDGDAQPGLRRRDAELATEVGQDRLGRVHDGEHRRRCDQERRHGGAAGRPLGAHGGAGKGVSVARRPAEIAAPTAAAATPASTAACQLAASASAPATPAPSASPVTSAVSGHV